MKSIKFTLFFTLVFSAISFYSNAQSVQTDIARLDQKKIEIKVKGVGCADDIRMITENVEKLEGVSEFSTIKKGATTKFQVILIPNLISIEKVHAAIEDTPACNDPNARPYKVKK